MYCDPSSEPSCEDGSDEGSQNIFLCRVNKNHPYLSPNTNSYLVLCSLVRVFIANMSNVSSYYSV